MEYYDLFMQGPSVYIPVLVVSLLVTLIAYGAYPLLYARFKKKPISKTKYKVKCWFFNFLPMLAFFLLSDRTPAGPYLLWTSIFCHSGLNTLERRNLLADPDTPVSSSETDMEYNGKYQQPAIPDSPKKTKYKNRFCKLCGSPIDPATKKCNGCGKQYFRLPVRKKSGFIPKVVVFLSLLIVGLCIYRNVQYQDQIGTLNARISELESVVESAEAKQVSNEALISDLRKKNAGNSSKVYTLSQQVEKMQRVYDFCNDHIVVVSDDGTRTYHKVQCFYFDDSYFWAYNLEAAQQQGYKPCSFCFSRYFDSLTN